MRSLRPRIAAAVLLCCGAAGPLAAQDLTVDEQLQFADGLYARGLHETARTEYQRFIDAHPDHPRSDVVHFRLGECARAMGDPMAAVKAYFVVVQEHPDSAYAHRAGFRRAETFHDAGMHGAAADLFGKLLATKPPDDIASAALFLRGEALMEQDKTGEAAEAYQALIDGYPDAKFHAYALLALGELRKRDEDTRREALALFERAAKEAKTDRIAAEALYQTAELHRRLGEDEAGAKAFRLLMSRYPEDRRARQAGLSAAWTYLKAGLFADALALRPDDEALQALDDEAAAEWLYLAANAQRQLGRGDHALATYGRMLTSWPNTRYAGAASYETALLLYRQGRYAEAIAQARRFAWPDHLERDLLWLLAESHAAVNEADAAVQYYRQLLAKHPDSPLAPDSAYRLAHLLQKREEYTQAAQQYHALVEESPDHALAPQALFAAAYCEVRSGDHAAAVRDWARLLEEHPKHKLTEEALYQKAMSEVFLERDGAAVETLRALFTRYPKTDNAPEARFWLGVLYRDAGTLKDAEDNLRQAVRLAVDTQRRQRAELYLGLTLYDAERHDEAARLLTGLIGSEAGAKLAPSLLEWLHGHWMAQGKAKQALPVAERIAGASTNRTWQQLGWCLVGRSHLALEDDPAAAEAFRRALETRGNTAYAGEAALRLGEIAVRAGESEAAEEHFRDAIGRAMGDDAIAIRSHAYAGLGRAALRREDHDAAARYFMSVAVLFEDAELVPECLFRAAEAYRELGRDDARLKAQAELRERYPESAWTDRLPPVADATGETNGG